MQERLRAGTGRALEHNFARRAHLRRHDTQSLAVLPGTEERLRPPGVRDHSLHLPRGQERLGRSSRSESSVLIFGEKIIPESYINIHAVQIERTGRGPDNQ